MIDSAWSQPAAPAVAAFAALTVALAALWLPSGKFNPPSTPVWAFSLTAACVAAAAAGIVDPRGLLALLVLAASCVAARRASSHPAKATAHIVMLTLCATLFLHVIPGFENPLVLDAVVLAPDSAPYTKYLNFDKGAAALLLLGLYALDRTTRDPILAPRLPGVAGAMLWRFALLAVTVLALSVTLGFLRWDPKLPAWWLAWVWSMVFLTALPEEAIFRGVAQHWLTRRLGGTARDGLIAAVLAGTLFGVAHAGGGVAYVVLAIVAGVGYGWIYQSTGSFAAAVIAHAGLNTLHFLLFSYPSLR